QDVGIGAGGREALVLAHLRRDLRRQRDRQVGPLPGEDVAGRDLVRRIGEAVEEADGDALDALGLEQRQQGFDRGAVERQQHLAGGTAPLLHRQAKATRHQWRRLVEKDVVLLEAARGAYFDAVAESGRREQRGRGGFALDQAVGR